MIPILYDKNETTFTHNGIGLLADASKCLVTEVRNGEYECELEYPLTGMWFKYITYGSIIKAKANETSELQLFRIYRIGKPMRGFVSYSAYHISYDLSGLPLAGLKIENTTAQNAIDTAIHQSGIETPFSALSDIETLNTINLVQPCSVRASFGGQQGSVLDVWGGEYEFDNFVVKLHGNRGQNNGVSIEYGKNLKDLQQDENIAETYTHFMPFATYSPTSETGEALDTTYIYLSEKIIALPTAKNLGHTKCAIVDFTSEFSDGEEVTEAKLRAKAESFAQKTEIGIPKVNIKVSFVQLWQTEEYKNIAPLERVRLCDEVTVKFSELGINVTAKVIKTIYDTLKEKFQAVEIGNAKSSFVDDMANIKTEFEGVKNQFEKSESIVTDRINSAIQNATAIITGQRGGAIVQNPPYPAVPQELLSLDTGDINTAQSVWRWNNGGFGHSSTGYNGEYTLAFTNDGRINAEMITAGEFDGKIIKAGTIKAEALDLDYRNSQIKGGINLVRNSSGLNGVSDDWKYTGLVEALQNAEAIANSTAKSMFVIGNDTGDYEKMTLNQSVEVKQGQTYTISLRAKVSGDTTDGYALVRNGGNEQYIFSSVSDWSDFELTFTALSDTIEFEAGRNQGLLYVADIMLIEGGQKSLWQPAPNEVYTSNTRLDGNGLRVTNSESKTETRIDYREFGIYHNDQATISVNKDLTTLRRTNIKGKVGIGDKLMIVPLDVGCDFVVLD